MKTKQIILWSLSICLFVGLCCSCKKKEEPEPSTDLVKAIKNGIDRLGTYATSKNPDYDFTVAMIEHHKAGLEMSKIELEKGTAATVRQIAQQTKEHEQQLINQLQQRVSALQTQSPNLEFKAKLIESAKTLDTRIKSTRLTGRTDADFALLMILHHHSGMEKAREYLKYGQDQSLKTEVQKVMEEHLQEMDALQQWLNRNL